MQQVGQQALISVDFKILNEPFEKENRESRLGRKSGSTELPHLSHNCTCYIQNSKLQYTHTVDSFSGESGLIVV